MRNYAVLISAVENEHTIDFREVSVMKPVSTSKDRRGEPRRGGSSVGKKTRGARRKLEPGNLACCCV